MANWTPKKNHTAFVKVYTETNNVTTAMLAAGYSEAQARKGVAALPKSLREFVRGECETGGDLSRIKDYAQLAKTPGEAEELVRGKLVGNIIEGVQVEQSARVLGQLNTVGLFDKDLTKESITENTARRILETYEKVFRVQENAATVSI